MTQIQIKRDLSEQLIARGQPVELRDEHGRLVGFFVPAKEGALGDFIAGMFPDEEIRAAQQETGGFTWKEIREELEAKWPST